MARPLQWGIIAPPFSTDIVGDGFVDPHTIRNCWRALTGSFRQSVFGHLGGYKDVNDAARLGDDPAIRWVVGGWAVAKLAMSASQMRHFETEFLAADENLTALADPSRQWVDLLHAQYPPKAIVLDMDSRVSPTHGDQERAACNGHIACTCYRPPFVFNQICDLEWCSLLSGNVHSADGWRSVLEPIVIRNRDKVERCFFRGEAAFNVAGAAVKATVLLESGFIRGMSDLTNSSFPNFPANTRLIVTPPITGLLTI